SEADTSSQPDTNAEEPKNAKDDSVKVIVNDSMMKMSKSEWIIIISMSVIITIAIIISLIVIINTCIFTKHAKSLIEEQDEEYSAEDDIEEN
ncbi:MAG: hypothetical protein II201_00050, partial [Clostridia bacterium]|nr:hypothetical protein [Clostridia bacterium]